ncbi:MAG: hypothetical protein MJA31_14845 [Clostridia bacterium]|nr:hypothetical protein [Clostridia bacterium]
MYNIIGNGTIKIDNKILKFDYDIRKIIEFEKVYIIQLWNTKSNDIGQQPTSNIYCLDKQGKLVWNIKTIFENYNKYRDEFIFTSCEKEDNNKMRIRTACGIVAIIDPLNGCILKNSWSK